MKNKAYLAVLLVAVLAVTALVVGAAYIDKGIDEDKGLTETSMLDINDTSEYVAIDTKEATDETVSEITNLTSTEEVSDENTTEILGESVTNDMTMEKTVDRRNRGDLEETTESDKKTGADAAVLHFSDKDNLSWPLNGEIVIDYNMDNTIYFKTLNQYKCSPGILISGKVNDEVKSSARGQVKKVSNNEEIGNFVVMSLGDGYEMTYGCLKDIQVSEGQVLVGGTLLGYVNDPTKYYVEEGSGVYLKMTKDDKPVNPRYHLDVTR